MDEHRVHSIGVRSIITMPDVGPALRMVGTKRLAVGGKHCD